MYVKKKLNINIASIFNTLTEINNEEHDVAKRIKNKKQSKNKKSEKKQKTSQSCSERIRTFSVNL
jgi:23S rRNA maturation mini-RNase III